MKRTHATTDVKAVDPKLRHRSSAPASPTSLSDNEVACIREFLQGLSDEESRISVFLERDYRGVALAVALKELDLQETHIADRAMEEDRSHSFYFLSMGLRRLIVLMLGLHEDFPASSIAIPRSEQLAQNVLELAAVLGLVEHGRRMVALTWSGQSTITKTDTNLFRFELPAKIVDAQAHERGVEEHYRESIQKLVDRRMFETASGQSTFSQIQQILFDNVYVWRDQFMGYNADPLLDEAFFTMAWHHIAATPQFDSFNELKKFGGIPFLKYLMAAAVTVSFALKHERFAETITEKYPDILRANLLTISADREALIDDLRCAMDEFGRRFARYTPTSRSESEQLFATVALTRSNVDVVARPYAPLPVYVEFASTSVVKLVSGRACQMEFMLDSLRKNFPRDYSANQRGREASLQRALVELLTSVFPDVICRSNVKLRSRGRVLTDVDLAVFDPAYGDLILVQLKHQDSPGPDFKATNSRMGRFLRECVAWLSVVADWLETADENVFRAAFRLPRNAQITRVRKLIVARHHAYPLARATIDENTAYATWMQLYNAGQVMTAKQGSFRSINGLFSLLRQHVVGAPVRHHQDEQLKRFRLSKLEYETVQREK